jgi:hypothetical protein
MRKCRPWPAHADRWRGSSGDVCITITPSIAHSGTSGGTNHPTALVMPIVASEADEADPASEVFGQMSVRYFFVSSFLLSQFLVMYSKCLVVIFLCWWIFALQVPKWKRSSHIAENKDVELQAQGGVEDETLCYAWMSVGASRFHPTNEGSFWKRILEYYTSYVLVPSNLTPGSIPMMEC